MGKKKDKKSKKAKEQAQQPETTTTETEMETPAAAPKMGAKPFEGSYREFLTMMDELPEGDHFFDVQGGRVRVRVNPDQENGKKGRRNTQLNGKQITRPSLKALLDQETSPAEASDPVIITREMFERIYKRKALKNQLMLMQNWPTREVKKVKELDKKVSGVQVNTFLMQTLKATDQQVKDVFEALCRD